MAVTKERRTSEGITKKDILKIPVVISLLVEAGYEQVDSNDIPDGIIVYRAGRTIKRHGLEIQRHYALLKFDDEHFMIGWQKATQDNSNLIQLAVDNCIHREEEAFKHDNPFNYLAKIHKKFKDSQEYQIRDAKKD